MTLVKKTAILESGSATTPPIHEVIYKQLREQILFGEMAPGQAVTIQGLASALNAGMTPVREAIRRLISDGALQFQGNRRVSVPLLTKADVEELIFVRKTVESELARRAAFRIGTAGIARLEQIDSDLDDAIFAGDVQGYLRENYLFHATLYGYADAPIMAEVADRLWLRFGPSLRVVCGRLGTENLPDRHKDLLDGLGAGDVSAVAVAMAQDVEQGMQLVSAMITADRSSE